MQTPSRPTRLARTVIYESRWVNLYCDRVALPSGAIVEQYHFVDLGRAVAAIVENAAGEVLLERIDRYHTGLVNWELPAGRVEGEETYLAAAHREVLEETGYETTDHELIYTYNPVNGISNMEVGIVACRAAEQVGELDPDEIGSMRWHTWAEINDLLARREISDGLTLVGLLWVLR